MNTELLNELMIPTEEIKIDYDFTDRFLYFLYLKSNNKLECQRELNIELEEEMNLLQNGHMKIPSITIDDGREFDEYNVVIQSTILMCVRITNIRKMLYIAEIFNDIYSKELIEKLKHTLKVLQNEFKNTYKRYYLEKAEYKHDYKFINGRSLSLIEYLINKDLNIMFKPKELSNDKFFNEHKKDLYAYVSIIYLNLEIDYLYADVHRIANHYKSNMDFIEYKSIMSLLQKELECWNKEYMTFLQKNIDYDEMDKYRQTHQLIVIEDGDNEEKY